MYSRARNVQGTLSGPSVRGSLQFFSVLNAVGRSVFPQAQCRSILVSVHGLEQTTGDILGTIIYLGKTKSKHLRLGLLVLPPSSRWDRRGAVFVRYLHYVPDLSLAVWGWTWEVLGWGGCPVAHSRPICLTTRNSKKRHLAVPAALRLHPGYGCCAWADSLADPLCSGLIGRDQQGPS